MPTMNVNLNTFDVAADILLLLPTAADSATVGIIAVARANNNAEGSCMRGSTIP